MSALSAAAIDPNRTVSQYLHDSWGSDKGLPSSSISAIAQTTDGYLWLGTDKGLIRFDGLSFRRFEQANPSSFPIGPVRSLLTDDQNNLWVLLENTKLFRYHDGAFELSRGEAENGITAMGLGPTGEVVLSSLAMGVLTFNGKQFLSALPPTAWADPKYAAGEIPDERSARLNWSTGVVPHRLVAPTSAAISMVSTKDGKVWLGTQDKGLFYLRDGNAYAAVKDSPNLKIHCFLSLDNSELWVGTNKGVVRWNGSELTRSGVPRALQQIEVLAMIRDRDANFWLGTSRGLLRVNTNGGSFVGRSTFADAPVNAVFEDREGNIWLGTARGLDRLRDSAFLTYSLPNLKSQSMGPVHADSGGRTWIAPIQGGLRWLKDGQTGVIAADGIANDVVYSITGTGKDDVWVGRQQGGLTHLRFAGNSLTAKTYTRANGLAQDRVFAVYQSRDGTVWSGTLGNGVIELKNGRFRNYTATDGLAANAISSIAEDPDGTMWFGTPNGVSAMSQKGWRTYGGKDGLPSEDVNCLLQDSTRILWIGTAEGLAYLSDGHMQVLREVPESLQAPIFGIEEDKNGRLWIATSDHVLRVPRDKLLSGIVKAVDVREYDQADGLQSTEGVKRSRSVVSDSAGRIWFSLNSGLSVVNPSQVNDNSVPALPHIEAITADDNSVNLAAPVRIPPSSRRITFSYTGLSLAVRGRIRFRYFLENFDNNWSQPVAAREAVYTNLGPGSYRFRLAASNSEGLWNGPETAIALNVAPAYYQTYLFRVSCMAAFLLLLWVLHRLRLRRLAYQFNMRLEERVSERMRIARDLHDTLLQSFQGLMLHFQTGIDLLPGRPAEARKTLEIAIDRGDQAIAEGRGAVQGLRASTVETNDLASAVRILGEELRAEGTNQNSALFEMEVEGTPRNLHPILRDEVYRITCEALRNAFRHARAQRIEVEILYGERWLRLRIRDDGKGIDPKLLSGDGLAGHYGLHGMRERAKLVGGRLAVWSKLDSGTEVELSIPASAANANPARHRSWWFEKLSGKGTDFKETDVKEIKTKS